MDAILDPINAGSIPIRFDVRNEGVQFPSLACRHAQELCCFFFRRPVLSYRAEWRDVGGRLRQRAVGCYSTRIRHKSDVGACVGDANTSTDEAY